MKNARILAAVFYIAGIVFLCVWQRVEIVRLGYIIVRAETRLEQVRKENRLLRLEYSRAASPENFDESLFEKFRISPPEGVEIIEVLLPGEASVRGGGKAR